jgi:hypothetical protein
MGCCTNGTPNTLAYYGDAATLSAALGVGKAAELAGYVLRVAGGVVGVVPLNPTTRGGVGPVTKIGTGAETLTVSIAPHLQITIQCSTGGTLGTAAFTFQLGSGAISAPVTSAAGWSSTGYLVPGTFCTVIFTAGTYVAGGTPDIYIIATSGAVTHPQGTGPAVPTFTASPIDDYNVKVVIVVAGALATMQFTYSLDSTSGNTSSAILSAGSGVYAIPGTGLVLTFAGTSTATDYFTFQSAAPTPANADVTAANTALQTTYLSSLVGSMIGVDSVVASASAWTTLAALLESSAGTLGGLGIYLRYLLGTPTVGTVLPNAGSITVDSADTDSVVIAQRQTWNNPHVNPCGGDFSLTSSITGLSLRRNDMWSALARSAAVEASQSLGWVGSPKGSVTNATALFRDEQATPGFDAAGITSLRTFPGAGASGIYFTDAHTGALPTSDYFPWANARVVDIAATVVRLNGLPLVNGKVPTTTRNGLPGVVTEPYAQRVESSINSALKAVLVDGSPQNAVATKVVLNRTNNVLATSQLIFAVSVQPFGYSKFITFNVGLVITPA